MWYSLGSYKFGYNFFFYWDRELLWNSNVNIDKIKVDMNELNNQQHTHVYA